MTKHAELQARLDAVTLRCTVCDIATDAITALAAAEGRVAEFQALLREALLREALDMLRVAVPWPGTHDKTDALIARIDAHLSTAPVAAPPTKAEDNEYLPCAVRLPPNTIIGKGCKLSTLLLAMHEPLRAGLTFEPVAAPVGWQPIECAPHTGIAVLLWQPWKSGHSCTVIGHYANGWVCEQDEGSALRPEPTHWMPLPAPPTTETKR